MEFNDIELKRILIAFGIQENEVGLNDVDEEIVRKIETHLKVEGENSFFYNDDLDM